MTDETKAVDEFLGDLKDNGDTDPLAPSTEDPFESVEQTEEKGKPEAGGTVGEEPKDEKPLPFHKDPKVQRYIEREIAKRIPEQPAEERTQESDNYFDDVIKSFTDVVGNDTPEKMSALNSLKSALINMDDRAADRAFQRIDAARQEEVALEQEYRNKLVDGFESIEEDTGIDLYAPENKRLRVKFIDFIERISPKEDGEISDLPDIGETFNIFRATYKPVTQTPKAKELASKSMEHSNGDVSQQKETGGLTWENVMDKIGL